VKLMWGPMTDSFNDPVVEIVGDSGDVYRVDTINGRCSCPAWIFSRKGSKRCKHLDALGVPSYQGGKLIKLPGRYSR
jgi:predicted nucleic acid-binding Zn finger protein